VVDSSSALPLDVASVKIRLPIAGRSREKNAPSAVDVSQWEF
jgi:hypothetical protein